MSNFAHDLIHRTPHRAQAFVSQCKQSVLAHFARILSHTSKLPCNQRASFAEQSTVNHYAANTSAQFPQRGLTFIGFRTFQGFHCTGFRTF